VGWGTRTGAHALAGAGGDTLPPSPPPGKTIGPTDRAGTGYPP
jgi:hypothetical protein